VIPESGAKSTGLTRSSGHVVATNRDFMTGS
jgi:hypothetical protein